MLRNGIEIGAATVSVAGPVAGTWAYALRSIDGDGQHWLRLPLPGGKPSDLAVPREEWARFQVPEEFRRAVAGILQPGSKVIVTSDSRSAGSAGSSMTVVADAS